MTNWDDATSLEDYFLKALRLGKHEHSKVKILREMKPETWKRAVKRFEQERKEK